MTDRECNHEMFIDTENVGQDNSADKDALVNITNYSLHAGKDISITRNNRFPESDYICTTALVVNKIFPGSPIQWKCQKPHKNSDHAGCCSIIIKCSKGS